MPSKMQIILNNCPPPMTEIFADGKRLVFKKVKKSRRYAAEIETDNASVQLTVQRHTFLQLRLWWFWEILFYILSIFGLLDVYGTTKNFCQAACKVNLPVQEGAAYTFTIGNPIHGKQVLRFSDDASIVAEENLYYLSASMAKRAKALQTIKILCPILFVVGIIVAVIVL